MSRLYSSLKAFAYPASQLQLGEGMDIRDKIPEKKMFEITEDLAAVGVEAVTFSGGGEPLIDKPLPEGDERFDKDNGICPFLQFLTVIGADLNVYTCRDKASTDGGMLGSIKVRSFKDFWYSDENHKRLYAVNPSRHCQHHRVTHAKNLAVFEALETGPDERVLDALGIDPDHGVFV